MSRPPSLPRRRPPLPLPAVALPLAMALLLAATPVLGRAQAPEIGVKVGLNHATVAWETTPLGSGFEEVERVGSLVVGLTLDLPLGDRLRLRAEALHLGKGFREVQANGDETLLDLAYLEVPVLLGARLPGTDRVTPELYAGPYLAWETSCRLGGRVGDTEVDLDCEALADDPVLRETTDWGGVAGVALHLGNATGLRAVFDLRYSLGLRNVDAAPEVDNLDIRHRGLGLTAGLALPLGS